MPTNAIKTPDGFRTVADDVARHQVALDKLEAAEEAEIIRIRDKRKTRIEELKDAIKAAKKDLVNWLKKHRSKVIPEGRQSAESQLAEFGFRSSSSIVALSSEWDADRSIEACIQHGLDSCVVTVYRLDKEALEKLPDEDLAKVGLRRRPTETFWLKPKTGTASTIS